MWLFLLSAWAFVAPAAAIINGTQLTTTSAYPFVVSLQWENHHKCTGTLIDRKTVLTFDHCYHKIFKNRARPEKVSVVIGAANLTHPGIRRVKIAMPPIWPDNYPESYKKSLKNATYNNTGPFLLLKLREEQVQSNTVDFARLTDAVPHNGKVCDVIGWGTPQQSSKGPRGESSILRVGRVKIHHQSRNYLLAKQHQGQGNPCFGDGGAPLVCGNGNQRYVAALVLGGGEHCATKSSSKTLFGKLERQISWIRRHKELQVQFGPPNQ